MAAFNLQIGIDPSGARSGAKSVQDALKGIDGGTDRSRKRWRLFRREIKQTGSTAQSLKGIFRAVVAGAATQQVIKYADSYTKLNNQIKLVTGTSREAAIIQNELFKLASETRGPVEELATLYGRAAFSAKELGASQGELLEFTRGVSQALQINGTSAQEAKGALLQLSQALGSSIVRAEEFNAINEGAKPILIQVADGLGKTVAQLRAAVVAGEVTNKEFFQAFQKGLPELDRLFKKTAPTIGSAFTELDNSLILVAGRLQDSTGFATGFGNAVRGVAEFIKGPGLDFLVTFSTELGLLGDEFSNLKKVVGESLSSINPKENPSLDLVRRGLTDLFTSPISSIKAFVQIAVVEVVNFFQKLVLETKIRVNRIKGFFAGIAPDAAEFLGIDPNFNFAGAEAALQQEFTNLDNAKQVSITKILAGLEEDRAAIADAVNGVREEFDQAEVDQVLASAPTIGSGNTPTADPNALDKKTLDSIKSFEEANNAAIAYSNTLAEIALRESQGADETAVLNARTAALEAFQQATGAADEYNDKLEQAKDIFADTRTEAERFAEELQNLKELLDEGFITQDTFDRAKKQLEEATEQTNFMRDIAKAAAEDIQGAFRDLFLEGTSSLSDFADQFGQTLQRIAANFLANEAIKFLLGENVGEGQFGGVLGGLGGIFKSTGGTPGIVPESSTTTIGDAQGALSFDNILQGAGDPIRNAFTQGGADAAGAVQEGITQGGQGLGGFFANLFGGGGASGGGGGGTAGLIGGIIGAFAGGFDSGGRIPSGQVGLVGERGPEIVGGPASVVSRATTAQMMGGSQEVVINNITDPREAAETLNTSQGDKNIVNSITRNQASIKRALGLA